MNTLNSHLKTENAQVQTLHHCGYLYYPVYLHYLGSSLISSCTAALAQFQK